MASNSGIENLREQERQELAILRSNRRADAINSVRRGLGYTSTLKYSESTVSNIISKLKSKTTIDTDDLLALMYALSENEHNISLFFQVPGAMHGLIRELTGNHSRRQLIAAGCICNLALGPEKSCLSLCKASGAYLITYLQSHNRNLLELCTWAIGNLCANNRKTVKLLESQGLIDAMILLLSDNYDDDIKDSTAYAFGHIIYSSFDILKVNQTEEITNQAISYYKNSDQMKWLIYLLSDKDSAQKAFISNNFFHIAITELIELTHKFNPTDMVAISCLLKTAANLCDTARSEDSIIFSKDFVNLIHNIFHKGNVELINNTYWLLGNICNLYSDSPQQKSLFTEISFALSHVVK